MVDHLKALLEKLRKSSKSPKRRANLYTEIAKMKYDNLYRIIQDNLTMIIRSLLIDSFNEMLI